MGEGSDNLVLLKNGSLVDGSGPDPTGTVDVLVEEGWIREVSDRAIEARGAQKYDLKGRTLNLPVWRTCR